jgi:hypothetical protein
MDDKDEGRWMTKMKVDVRQRWKKDEEKGRRMTTRRVKGEDDEKEG